MNRFLKICLIVLMVLPIWLTIVAFADESKPSAGQILAIWKEKMNAKLLAVKDRHIQVSELMTPSTDFSGADENSSFEIDLSAVKTNAISDLALKFRSEEGALVKLIRVRAKLFVEDQVPVATHTLNAGDAIQSDDFKMEWRDTSTFRGAPLQAKEITSCTVRTTIQQGEPFYDNRIQRPHLVARGDHVKISVVGKGIVISAMGIAEESGSKGQTIKVMNNDSRKELFGVVTDTNQVEVRL
jgi:flagella basal body P-ring formation protein FlgA